MYKRQKVLHVGIVGEIVKLMVEGRSILNVCRNNRQLLFGITKRVIIEGDDVARHLVKDIFHTKKRAGGNKIPQAQVFPVDTGVVDLSLIHIYAMGTNESTHIDIEK